MTSYNTSSVSSTRYNARNKAAVLYHEPLNLFQTTTDLTLIQTYPLIQPTQSALDPVF